MPNMALWCCCGGCITSADGCSQCDDLTPRQYDFTFSGITECPGCFTVDGVDFQVEFINGFNPNSTFRLTQTADGDGIPTSGEVPCGWRYESSGDVIRIRQYISSDGSCSPLDITIDLKIRISLFLNVSTWELYAGTPVGTGVYELSNSADIFCSTAAVNTDGADQLCATLPSFTSNLATCGNTADDDCPAVGGGGVDDPILATGGSATGVCVE